MAIPLGGFATTNSPQGKFSSSIPVSHLSLVDKHIPIGRYEALDQRIIYTTI
jgi:tRNA G37 N-methylase TrmD